MTDGVRPEVALIDERGGLLGRSKRPSRVAGPRRPRENRGIF